MPIISYVIDYMHIFIIRAVHYQGRITRPVIRRSPPQGNAEPSASAIWQNSLMYVHAIIPKTPAIDL